MHLDIHFQIFDRYILARRLKHEVREMRVPGKA